MAKFPLISLIVPAYKAEKHIKRCADSILGQTYTNEELILIDDGSYDGCSAVCDEYATSDDRVVVIHKKNGGVSMARNAGIDVAKGEYITFVDADDYVENRYIEHLYQAFENNDGISMSATSFIMCYISGNRSEQIKECKNDKTAEVLMLLNPSHWLNSVWGKLYIRDTVLYNGLRFDSSIFYAEDSLFLLMYINSCEGFFIHKNFCDYYYWRQDESTTNSDFSLSRLSLLTAFDKIQAIVQNKKAKDFAQVTKVSYSIVFFHAMRNVPKWKSEKKALCKKLAVEMKTGLYNPEMSIKIKFVALLIVFHGYWLYNTYKEMQSYFMEKKWKKVKK